MESCVLKTSPEYKKLRGLSRKDDFDLSVQIANSMDMNGRYPYLDEMIDVDSLPTFEEQYNARWVDDSIVIKESDLPVNGSLEQNMQYMNSTYRDYEMSAVQIGDNVVINPIQRPSFDRYSDVLPEVDGSVEYGKNKAVFNVISQKMNELYGIQMEIVNNDDVAKMSVDTGLDFGQKNGFIYNNTIYINSDIASLDTPVHEMMHMLLGELRFNDFNKYMEMVSSVKELDGFEYMKNTMYPNHAMSDAMEEIFVTEASKYMVGANSLISKLPKELRSTFEYNIQRMIDSSVFGTNTVRTIPFNEIGRMSLIDLCVELGSTLVNNKTTVNNDVAFAHRILANEKVKLIQDGLLKEFC